MVKIRVVVVLVNLVKVLVTAKHLTIKSFSFKILLKLFKNLNAAVVQW